MSRPPRPAVYSLAVELTPYCNQKCAYCYNDWRDEPSRAKPLPPAELLGLLGRAADELELDHVTLTGGEPFAWPWLFDALSVLRDKGLRAMLISNGGLVTEALAERLAPFEPIWVQITLNGPDASLHEEHVGLGHFAPTLRGIRALLSRGVAVAGCVVVTRKNAARVHDILELFRSLGVNTIALSRYSPAGYAAEHAAELLPARRDIVVALDQAEAHSRAHGTSVQVTMPVPPCVIEHASYPRIRFGGCPIGTSAQELALGADGKVRNCTLHTAEAGDPSRTSFAHIVESAAVRGYRDVTPEFCEPCSHRSTCLGGCGAAAASLLGNPRGLDPFVAQHVDDDFAARLRAARASQPAEALIPVGRLRRVEPRASLGPSGEGP
jgi:radical SAM protein with 4Fe4S-binding SPASM domain